MSSLPLADQVAVVTGGARGIGAAIAARLRADGATVVVFDRAPDEGRPAVDVTDEHAVQAAVAEVVARHGRIDVLVNNAGVYPHVPFEAMTLDTWRAVMGLNLDGVFVCSRAVFPVMREQGYGRIVNIVSSTFFIGQRCLTAYVASKGGVIGFTRALATEAGPLGITVNAVAPGLIDTRGAAAADPLFDEVVGAQAIGRAGAPNDVAEAVAYVVTPAAGFITGQTINVDGGHRYH
ncbi:SDR family NAD(P)-dependent oxidoreductase [Capillimicrobium parvum]|uniref:Pyridoxal 4-dehydrogenase n=1 Tax=Capillimicrobium parvum TaxID=2884022 RepID=A0A9E6XXE4_9ACTN|nr:SDR family NAD(P)-dependent oxidoreductase [Capillimicrobium parvum]UGS35995.1 Pyridoxal 4-dehydrogenase [Capillimicrobium parvum]